jgi:predicted helicase
MTLPVIKHYYDEVEKVIQFGGTKKETAIRNSFYILLNEYARSKGLMVVPEITIKGTNGRNVTPDGTLKDALRQDIGYWESKDEDDDLKEEIKKKFNKGYPKSNILFEDGYSAILYQNGQKVLEVEIADSENLDKVLKQFINYEREEVHRFRDAIEHFKQDIPNVTETLRKLIAEQERGNKNYIKARISFLEILKDSINPDITTEDVKEMMIQHILTADIFNTIFDEGQYHKENNIARELEKVVETFFTGTVRRETLVSIKHYYQTIKANASGIADHHEKQRFLKVIYEAFYKSYNPKAADRLGVVYTPNEIVRSMLQGVDHLLYKHFNKYLHDEGVEILDIATGTGTFVCDLIDYIKKDKLEYKYKNEIHANELAILPYYIANLNIEFTYTQKMGAYSEFINLCLVDTLDNMSFSRKGQASLFSVSAENAERIKKQNKKKISVIMGNPPYNANQQNENDNNKNREYKIIDERIKETYIKHSTAQKTKLYDMYSRFYRWAMDRIDENGVIAFITNRSFINARTFDGFRKCIQDEFNFAYIIDLGGDIRELSGKDGIFLNEKHTIFGTSAAVGIAICYLVKVKGNKNKCRINYIHPCDIRATRDEKIMYLYSHKFHEIPFEQITPDKNNNWINLANNDFEKLIPVCDKQLKGGKRKNGAIFESFSLGVITARDEWVYDLNEQNLKNKVKFLINVFNKDVSLHSGKVEKSDLKDVMNYSIKWTRAVKNDLSKGKKYVYEERCIQETLFRPFFKKKLYFNSSINEMQYQLPIIYPKNKTNFSINFLCVNSSNPLCTLISKQIFDYCLLKMGNGGTQCLPLYTYDSEGKCHDNITDWGLEQFTKQYKDLKKITKIDIFHYVYAVLHNPAYRKKYELNLKREFPRIPFYKDFAKWRDWGKKLVDIHLDYETAKHFKLTITNAKGRDRVDEPKTKLKADKDIGIITLDENTIISDIPKEAWDYKLGNRSALEWILDQYKEKKPTDPTIAEKFNTYKFADYKDHVIDLLKRVCTVSVETVRILKEMDKE